MSQTFISNNLSGSTISGNTYYSGGTPLAIIISNLAVAGSTTLVQSGLNTYTGGTSSAPTINISAATLSSLSATTLSSTSLYLRDSTNTGVFSAVYSYPTLTFDTNSSVQTVQFFRNGTGIVLNNSLWTDLNQTSGVRVTGNLSVGAGNTSYKFDVNGNSNFSGGLTARTISATTITADAISATTISGGTIYAIADGAPLRVNSSNSNSNKIIFSDAGVARGYLGAANSVPLTIVNPSDNQQVFRITNVGVATILGLTGSTTRMVVADSGGVLSTQTIPATRIQNGLNTYTGGTADAPTVNISAATLSYLSATTISGETLFASTKLSATSVVTQDLTVINNAFVGGLFTTPTASITTGIVQDIQSNTIQSLQITGKTISGDTVYTKQLRTNFITTGSTYAVQDNIVTVFATGAGMNVILPLSANDERGRIINIKNANTGGSIDLYASGADLLEGVGTPFSIPDLNSVTVQSDGAGNWWII